MFQLNKNGGKAEKVSDCTAASQNYVKYSGEHADYMKELVAAAGKADAGYHVFGSGKYKYRLKPVIPEEEVRRFEKTYQVKLPEEYVFFLTKVGNGGAGPYYGIYSLEDTAKYTEYKKTMGMRPWLDSSMDRAEWEKRIFRLEECDDEAYECQMDDMFGGLAVIGTQGCTYDNLLILSGPEKGSIVYLDWNLFPENFPVFTKMPFLEWYEEYFREIIRGNRLSSYGYLLLGTQEELIRTFAESEDAADKRKALVSLNRFRHAGNGTVRFLEEIKEPEYDAVRTELLLRFDEKAGIRIFERLLGGDNPQAAVRCARKMPAEYRNRYYNRMVGLLYRDDIPFEKTGQGSDRETLLYYLLDCSCLKAADIAAFAADITQDAKERQTAVYVMGKAGDRMEYTDLFRSIMLGEDYWPAHAALQAMAKEKDESLLPVYNKMWDRYREDQVMCANLKSAFMTFGISR